MDDTHDARVLYEVEIELFELGWSSLVYDEGEDAFRFPDGTFAFSRERVNAEELERRGYSP